MNIWSVYSAIAFVFFAVLSCKQSNPNYKQDSSQPIYFSNSVSNLTDIIVHDIFSPPVASRVYVYPCIAAYEALLPAHPNKKSFAGQLKGLSNVPQPKSDQAYCYPVASLTAFQTVAQQLIFSEDKMMAYESQLMEAIDTIGIPAKIMTASKNYGAQVAQHILKWASNDHYNETRSAPKYSINNEAGTWKPTPPAYMEGIEPSWKKIRTMVLDLSLIHI